MISVRLCQALNGKICHDFAGSIGVIDNSIQLTKSKHYQEKATNLMQNSANNLIGRLQFYRHLYSISFDNNLINIDEIDKLSINFLKLQNYNIQLILKESKTLTIKDSLSKIIMCIILIASSNLKQDGTITLDFKKIDNYFTNTKIVITSEKLKLDDDKVDILLGKGDINNITIDNIHEYYTYYLMIEYDYQLAIISTQKSIEYILTNTSLDNNLS